MMRRVIRAAVLAFVVAPLVFAVAFALGFPVAVLVAGQGLAMEGPSPIVIFGIAGALAALGAAWFSNLLARGRTRARLGRVFLWTEATVLVVAFFMPAVGSLRSLASMTFFIELLASMVPVALAATLLSMRLRGPGTGRRRDVALGLAVAVAAALAPLLVLSEACPYVGCDG